MNETRLKFALAAAGGVVALFLVAVVLLGLRLNYANTERADLSQRLEVLADPTRLAELNERLAALELQLNAARTETVIVSEELYVLRQNFRQTEELAPGYFPLLPAVHTVQAGDTINSIAAMYFGESYIDKMYHIIQTNPRAFFDARMLVGTQLVITPIPGWPFGVAGIPPLPTRVVEPPAVLPHLPTTHTVGVGDHIRSIAMYYFGNDYAETINHIVRDNQPRIFDRNILHVGWVLQINPMPDTPQAQAGEGYPPFVVTERRVTTEGLPPSGPRATSSPPIVLPQLPTTHTVGVGDHIQRIAMRYFGNDYAATIDHIVRDNYPKILDRNILHVGWVLQINPMD